MLHALNYGAHQPVLQRQLWRHVLAVVRIPIQGNGRLYSVPVNGGSVSYLRNGENGAEIYLVGTAHVSAKSADEVKEVIEKVKPDTVAVELCAARAKKMMQGDEGRATTFFQHVKEMLNLPGGLGQKLIAFWLKSMYELIRNTGVEPGKEFRVAMEEAQRIGAKLFYIDQDVNVTMKRLRDVITLWDVLKFLKTPNPHLDINPAWLEGMEKNDFEDAVERLKSREKVRQLMSWMESAFPDVVKVMVHERDKLMVKHLRNCEGKVVGVVGMAHMDGIERLWKQAESQSV